MELLDRLEEVFGQRPLAEVNLPGGSIGEVHLVKMADGEQLVAKLGGRAEGGLLIEAAMLRYLADHSQLPVPAVIHAEDTLLILEFLPGRSEFSPAAEADAARHLAALHTITAPRFGFDSDTLIGAFSQPNPWSEDWIPFFAEQRLLYMGRLCLEAERLPASYLRRLEAFCDQLDRWLLAPAAPALVHGDIWATNVLAQGDQISAFLDPALYYGHAEVELAYIALFGTFAEPFFRRYQEIRPLPPGFFETRRDVYNLYPLLVHVRHFGGSYLNGVDRTLARFGF